MIGNGLYNRGYYQGPNTTPLYRGSRWAGSLWNGAAYGRLYNNRFLNRSGLWSKYNGTPYNGNYSGLYNTYPGMYSAYQRNYSMPMVDRYSVTKPLFNSYGAYGAYG